MTEVLGFKKKDASKEMMGITAPELHDAMIRTIKEASTRRSRGIKADEELRKILIRTEIIEIVYQELPRKITLNKDDYILLFAYGFFLGKDLCMEIESLCKAISKNHGFKTKKRLKMVKNK